MLAYDAFHLRTTIRGKSPWPELPGDEWTSVHDILAAEWLQHEDIFVGPDITGQAVEAVARERRFHPVLEYLERCVWDGIPRLDLWVVDYLGAADTPYNRAVGSRWMIAAVARVYEPGCKVDSALVLEGDQNTGKSTAIKTLGVPWFTDEIADLGTKDAALQLAGVWIIELAELDSVSRAEVGRIKSFMSRATDRYRPPYGRRPIDQPRQCVYAGTVNHSEYLRDETGGRRFWPVKCAQIDIVGLAQVRNQLWAEARARYLAREPWHLDTKELNDDAEEEQTARYLHDAWEKPIAEFIANRIAVNVGEILKDALFITTDKWSQPDQNRVARVLRLFKWQRKQERIAGTNKRHWVYRPPDVQPNQRNESGDF
jgi:predicted P-loop ATPase